MRSRRLWSVLGLAALPALLAVGGQSVAANPQGIAPFTDELRVVGFSMTATLTYANTAATIKYRLVKPSVARTLVYLGPRPKNPNSAWKLSWAAPVVDVVAEATYTSPDPSCTGKTIEYRPAGNKIVQAFVHLEPPRGVLRRVSASVGRIPLAVPFPGQDGADTGSSYPRPKCGQPKMGDWYQDMVAVAPARLLSRPRVKISGHHKQRFTDPGIESIEWSLEVILQRLRYRAIDCATHPGC